MINPSVEDLQHRDDLEAVQIDRDVQETLQLLGIEEDYNYLLVKIEDGEYVEAYGVEGIPYLHKTAWTIIPKERREKL